MTEALPNQMAKQVNALIQYLIVHSLADDQNNAYVRDETDSVRTVTHDNNFTLGNSGPGADRYADLHTRLTQARSYNARMLDGALIQIWYEFRSKRLQRARLAFLPAPDLLRFQDYAELYVEDSLFLDVIDPAAVTVPLRFEYDNRHGVPKSLLHPEAHFTLGQYKSCRIACTAVPTPLHFGHFVLNSFYRQGTSALPGLVPDSKTRFRSCITLEESIHVHMGVPAFA